MAVNSEGEHGRSAEGNTTENAYVRSSRGAETFLISFRKPARVRRDRTFNIIRVTSFVGIVQKREIKYQRFLVVLIT